MSEFKFDKMKNLEIPDEWAEKTISTVSKLKNTSKMNIPYSRYALSFASIVFVVMLSVVVFMLTQNILSPDYEKKDKSTIAVTQTEFSTIHQSNVETSVQTDIQTQSSTEECTEDDNEYIDDTNPDEYEDPDESSNNSSSNNQNPDSPNNPNVEPNNGLKPNTPAEPSGKPNGIPSDPACKPNGSGNTKYTVAPDLDTDKPPEEKYLYTSFLPYPYVGPATGDEIFYCKILNREEEFNFDDPDLYDESRKVLVYSSNENIVTIRFCAGKNGGVTKNGDYDFYVYDANGVIQKTDRVRITWFNE